VKPDKREQLVKQQRLDFERKPLSKTQEYLRELRVCVVLLQDVLVKIKDLAEVIGLILFFVWGVFQLIHHMH
jgi:hypothetical protein